MGRLDRATLASVGAWTVVGLWACWAIVRLLGLEFGPLIPLIAFTPYVALTALLPVGVALVLRRRAAALAGAVAALALAALVLPREFGGPTEPAGATAGPTLRVLAANVKFGRADARELVELADELDVDALAVSELTRSFADELDRAGIRRVLPHAALGDAPSARGTGLYSDLSLTQRSVEALPGGFALVRATAAPPGGAPVELVAVHTVPPTTVNMAPWREDLASLPAAGEGALRVMFGDFNATLDHEDFREVVDRGYDDAADTLGDGLTPTWPADRPRLPALVTIDHVLADERIGIREYSVEDLSGSDHRPVFAELALPSG